MDKESEVILKVIQIVISYVTLLITIISTIIGLPKLYDTLKGRRSRRILIDRLSRGPFDEDVIERATHYFIEPNSQDLDPAGEAEIRYILPSSKSPLFEIIDKFIEMDTSYKHLMILADSGTGKTTFVLNYYARHEGLKRKKYQIMIIPLGHKDADAFIADLHQNPKIQIENTVLFLDAFDEDILAVVDHYTRIKELMEVCEKFKRVIITCRTQFFRKEDEIPKDTGVVRLGPRKMGEGKTYEFKKLYLSPFEDDDVKRYLTKRYPLWRYRTRKKAIAVALKVPLLCARPMLLAHIPEVVEAQKEVTHAYELYEIMVEKWLEREEGWIEKEVLREFSERLAMDIWLNRSKREMERVPHEELIQLAEKWQIGVEDWKLTGRSLLNRDVEGNFKFAHRSIMEYLFVRRFLRLPPAERLKVEWTDQMKSFLLEKIKHKTAGQALNRVDISWMNLSGMDLTSYDFTEANFKNANLVGAFIIKTKLAIKFVYIPPGTFMMGSPNENLHEVTLTQGFYMQTTPVTQGQWKAVMGNNPSRFKDWGDDCPVENVSWNDAQAFIKKLNQMEGKDVFRLPTEAEWEYACRAGSTSRYCFGDDEGRLSEYAWYEKNSRRRTHPVATKEPNVWGLYDIHGNVWEWCEDWYGVYPSRSVTDPDGPERGSCSSRWRLERRRGLLPVGRP